MVYCSKCGKKNEPDARFCNNCGASLLVPTERYRRHDRRYDREFEDKCDDECSGRRHPGTYSHFWVVILVLIAIGILLSIFFRIFDNMTPMWLRGFDFWDIIWLLIFLVVVIFIIQAIMNTQRKDR